MRISLIGAASDNNVIAKDNWMPWDLPAEIAHFRAVTRGKTVIMGRKTFDAMQRPMPNRHNIVVSRQPDLQIDGVDVVSSIEEAIDLAKKDDVEEACVIGGEQIYTLALQYADRIYLTCVHTTVDDGEAFFPEFDKEKWELVESDRHEPDQDNNLAFTTMLYEKKT